MNIVVTDRVLLAHLRSKFSSEHLIHIRQTPHEKYTYNIDGLVIEMLLVTNIDSNVFRGRSIDVIYCTPTSYSENTKDILNAFYVNRDMQIIISLGR